MENSKIEWTDHTWNPWQGCTKVSPGCKHCYAESLMDHRYKKVKWGPTGTRLRTSAAYWRKPILWDKQAKAEGVRYKVFSASLADVFENNPQVVEWRQDFFALINQTPNLIWLLLTKRPQHVFDFVPAAWLSGLPGNIWIGTSVENQEQADKRIPILMSIPARVRFLSVEPLLGPVDLWSATYVNPNGGFTGAVTDWAGGVQWVIVGGESGPEARPMQTKWAQSIRSDCAAANVPFFMKQLGGHPNKRHDLVDFPPELQVRQFPSA